MKYFFSNSYRYVYHFTRSSKINSLSSCSTIRYQLGMVPYWFHCSILFFCSCTMLPCLISKIPSCFQLLCNFLWYRIPHILFSLQHYYGGRNGFFFQKKKSVQQCKCNFFDTRHILQYHNVGFTLCLLWFFRQD